MVGRAAGGSDTDGAGLAAELGRITGDIADTGSTGGVARWVGSLGDGFGGVKMFGQLIGKF